MLQLGHESLSTFGIGQDVTEQEWRGVVRQLLAQGLLAVHGDGYGTLVITDASAEVLSGNRPVMLRREAPKAAKAAKRSAVAVDLDAAVGRPLRAAPRVARRPAAREQGVPAYIVFGDATLRGIATHPAVIARRTRHDQRPRREEARDVRRSSARGGRGQLGGRCLDAPILDA